ncbi:MAG: hypothetical protein GEV09_26380, partial [Pseudonocardiaceae bacterium]|nr:hypothetical protein [Pseudonocardiaceae bacterium]
MTKSKAAPGFRPAARVLALIMGVSLLVLGAAGLAWHLTGREHWLLGENIGLDVFHLVMGLLALGARPVGLSGVDGGLLCTRQLDERLGFVGEVMQVDRGPIDALLAAGYMPVISSLGYWGDQPGQLM